MLNLFQDFTPKFVKVYADLGGDSLEAMERFCQEVRDGIFPAEEHSF